MAFNWFFAFGKGTRPVFVKRSKPVPQVIQLLPLQLEGEEIKKGNETARLQLDELSKQVRKLGSKQDEMVMAVEDLTEGLEEQKESSSDLIAKKDKEINALISAMITAADYTEDFFNYAKESGNYGVYEQASFFWNALNKKFSAAGLVRIHDERTPPDPVFNHIAAAEESGEISKPGIIIKTLKSGYIYKDKIIRRSEVVVTKTKGDLN